MPHLRVDHRTIARSDKVYQSMHLGECKVVWGRTNELRSSLHGPHSEGRWLLGQIKVLFLYADLFAFLDIGQYLFPIGSYNIGQHKYQEI
jgi:hypothetical protein